MGQTIDVEDRCELIISWARDNEDFDTTMVESILAQYRERGTVTAKQEAAIDNIIDRFRINN